MSEAAQGGGPRLVVVTDLDGSLLDSAGYSAAAARPALAALARRRIPLVPCTSKTLAEVEALRDLLGAPAPMIVENGGAVVIPAGYFGGDAARTDSSGDPVVVPLGVPRARLVASLAQMARETGLRLRGFSAMEPAEVAVLTGLGPDDVTRAMARDYDEPFVFEEDTGAAQAVERAAAARGLRCSRGGRFWHLTGQTDKGRALRVLLGLFRARGRVPATVGLGDAENDAPMLLAVDRPILVPRPDGRVEPRLRRRLPAAEVAPAPGPAGWNRAVLALLKSAPRRAPASPRAR